MAKYFNQMIVDRNLALPLFTKSTTNLFPKEQSSTFPQNSDVELSIKAKRLSKPAVVLLVFEFGILHYL